MNKNQEYIKAAEKKLKTYKQKISQIESDVKAHKSVNKKKIQAEIQDVKQKYKDVEKSIKSLKSSSADNFEDVKELAIELFNDLKERLTKASALLTKENFLHAKEEATDYGKEKVTEIEGYIKKNPVTSAAISLAVGFVAGQLIRRSK